MSTEFTPLERSMRANGIDHHVLVYNDHVKRGTFVLCHGFLDLAWSYHWTAQFLCREGFRVVAFDWRGHGESDRVGAGGYYHFMDYVLDLHELMPVLADTDVHLVGHSMGGTACAYYAATHPHVAESLTLIEGLGPPHDSGSLVGKLRDWLDSIERQRRRAPRAIADLAEAVKRIRANNSDLPIERAYFLAEKATVESPSGRRWRFDPLHRTTSPIPFSAESFRTCLSEISAPTLIVNGDRGFQTQDHSERLAALPHAREVTLEGVGHMIHHGLPEELADQLIVHARSVES